MKKLLSSFIMLAVCQLAFSQNTKVSASFAPKSLLPGQPRKVLLVKGNKTFVANSDFNYALDWCNWTLAAYQGDQMRLTKHAKLDVKKSRFIEVEGVGNEIYGFAYQRIKKPRRGVMLVAFKINQNTLLPSPTPTPLDTLFFPKDRSILTNTCWISCISEDKKNMCFLYTMPVTHGDEKLIKTIIIDEDLNITTNIYKTGMEEDEIIINNYMIDNNKNVLVNAFWYGAGRNTAAISFVQNPFKGNKVFKLLPDGNHFTFEMPWEEESVAYSNAYFDNQGDILCCGSTSPGNKQWANGFSMYKLSSDKLILKKKIHFDYNAKFVNDVLNENGIKNPEKRTAGKYEDWKLHVRKIISKKNGGYIIIAESRKLKLLKDAAYQYHYINLLGDFLIINIDANHNVDWVSRVNRLNSVPWSREFYFRDNYSKVFTVDNKIVLAYIVNANPKLNTLGWNKDGDGMLAVTYIDSNGETDTYTLDNEKFRIIFPCPGAAHKTSEGVLRIPFGNVYDLSLWSIIK